MIEHFAPDTSTYDIIVGYRADDSYFRFAKDFLNNTISVEKLSEAMKLGKLGLQIVLISKRAFDSIRFLGSESVDHQIYHTKRVARDKKAREDYFAVQEPHAESGEYINDIMRKRIANVD